MFGLGAGEIVIILVLALILLGPQKLPDAAKQLGKGLREFRKQTDDLKRQFESELYSDTKAAKKPTLVDAARGASTPPTAADLVPAGGVPAATPAAEVPKASALNVPGLEAAFDDDPAPPPPAAMPPPQPPPAAAAPAAAAAPEATAQKAS
jgi:sec-independent protein translocase protein TatB